MDAMRQTASRSGEEDVVRLHDGPRQHDQFRVQRIGQRRHDLPDPVARPVRIATEAGSPVCAACETSIAVIRPAALDVGEHGATRPSCAAARPSLWIMSNPAGHQVIRSAA